MKPKTLELTVLEIKSRKKALQMSIESAIERFEKETGVEVKSVNSYKDNDYIKVFVIIEDIFK